MSYMDNIKTFAKAAKIPALICFFWCISGAPLSANEIEISKERLVDKIKGGWAGQFIGCTYGGPTEFKYKFAMIPDDVEIKWHKNAAKWQINANGEFGGLYDDVYLDITFMDVFEKQGFDAPRRTFKKAVSEGKYHLWAANYAARLDYMELADADKPVSWETNTNSNDIDFQIEADFAGLMSPALPRAALRFADKVGRAINGGEGYYCGAFIATMYSLAFVYDDIEKIIKESMKILPQESNTYEIAKDIMQWHGENPKDWKYTWKKLDEKHVKASKNSAIYAPFNMAYILVGLVYGEKDFGKTIDISTRCGLDSDCNPSNAAGILGAIIGYSQIPEKFMEPLKPYEETINFSGTSYTMAKTYAVGYSQALKVLKKYGAEISKESVKIKVEMPEPLKLEGEKPNFKFVNNDKIIFDENTASAKRNFNGCGLYITSDWTRNIKERPNSQNDAVESVAEFEIYVDGKLERTSKFFYNEFFKKKSTVHLNYGLTEGAHTLEIRKKKMVDGFKPIQFEIAYYRK